MRELRLIAAHKPRYNRRSRFPEKAHWIKLTDEPWPRLSLVRKVLDDEVGTATVRAARRRLPRSVRLAQGGRALPGRPPRDVPGAAVQRPTARDDRAARRACSPRCTAACPRATGASTSGDYALDGRRLLRDNLLRHGDDVVEAC